MEKPTGVIQKIIESLQQINTLDVYSPIEKDIILHNLRAAYMIFLNIPVKEGNDEDRIERLFVQETEKREKAEGRKDEEENVGASCSTLNVEAEIFLPTEEIIEEEFEDQLENHPQEIEEVVEIEEEIEEVIVEEHPQVPNIPQVPEEAVFPAAPLHDDILEFIPNAKSQPATLFSEMEIPKPEKKSLNDLLTEKKEDNSLGTHFQQSYIPDLTKAIAINEKFTFIRELFHNSGVDFSNAIQKLNECENIDTAFVLIEELKHQYIWDTTSSAYLTLCDLVRRRFL